MMKPGTKKNVPAEHHGTWRKVSAQAQKNEDKATFYSLTEAWATPAPTATSPNERELVVDSGASMQMLSKKDFCSTELESLRKSMIPTTVVTATGEVQTTEEAQVHVHDLDLLTWKTLRRTRIFLRVGQR